MFLRIDRLQTELPAPKKADPNAGAALQELLGGKYGEMSTLGNYFFQSFNFRSKSHDLTGTASAFAPDYAPEEMFEVATKLYKKAKNR
jgi:Mn-containing catalase